LITVVDLDMRERISSSRRALSWERRKKPLQLADEICVWRGRGGRSSLRVRAKEKGLAKGKGRDLSLLVQWIKYCHRKPHGAQAD